MSDNFPSGYDPDRDWRMDDERRSWRCYFCDEVFTDIELAGDHFGVQIDGMAEEPACKLNAHEGLMIKTIREQAEELRRYHEDDSEMARTFYALGAEHATALRLEEEKGYARGLRDGQALNGAKP